MKDVIARMKAFPAGGWDIDSFEDPGDWAKDMKMLDGTNTIRKIIVAFKELSTSITKVAEPEQMEDEIEDEDSSSVGRPSVPVKPEKGSGPTIHVSRGKKTKEPTEAPDVLQFPSVRCYFC